MIVSASTEKDFFSCGFGSGGRVVACVVFNFFSSLYLNFLDLPLLSRQKEWNKNGAYF